MTHRLHGHLAGHKFIRQPIVRFDEEQFGVGAQPRPVLGRQQALARG